MNKRGFTLIELTVVLIVIGLLLGFALKGRDILVTVKERQEIGRINKLEIAYNTAYSRIGGKPELKPGYGYLDMDYFKEQGLLEQTDIDSNIQGGFEWGYIPCTNVAIGYTPVESHLGRRTMYNAWVDGVNPIFNDGFMCVSLIKKDDYKEWGMGTRMMCLIERIDDNNTGTGRGRLTYVNGWSGPSDVGVSGCRLAPVHSMIMSSYIYRYIFRID